MRPDPVRQPSTLQALLDFRPPRFRVRYGAHAQQRAELHLPEGRGPHRVAVVVHGGYWRARRSRRYARPLCADLARRGWAAWNLEYRRVGRGQGGGWPATFADVAAGIDHLQRVDAELDLETVAAIGHSAGGHLALWAATRTRSPTGSPGARPRVPVTAGVAALAAVSDLEASPFLCRPGGAVFDLMSSAPGEVADDRFELANPIRRLPLGIPILLVHGEADRTIPVERSREFGAAARRAGDEVTLVELPGAGHRAVVDPRGAAWAETVSWLEALT